MLNINIVTDDLKSSFSGEVTLYFNTGGVRAAKEGDRLLKIKKVDSNKPQFESFISLPKSE